MKLIQLFTALFLIISTSLLGMHQLSESEPEEIQIMLKSIEDSTKHPFPLNSILKSETLGDMSTFLLNLDKNSQITSDHVIPINIPSNFLVHLSALTRADQSLNSALLQQFKCLKISEKIELLKQSHRLGFSIVASWILYTLHESDSRPDPLTHTLGQTQHTNQPNYERNWNLVTSALTETHEQKIIENTLRDLIKNKHRLRPFKFSLNELKEMNLLEFGIICPKSGDLQVYNKISGDDLTILRSPQFYRYIKCNSIAGKLLAYGKRHLIVWDLMRSYPYPIQIPSGNIALAEFNPSGTRIVTVDAKNRVQVWNVTDILTEEKPTPLLSKEYYSSIVSAVFDKEQDQVNITFKHDQQETITLYSFNKNCNDDKE